MSRMETHELRQDQLNHFSIIERVCSVFSLLGCIFIIATFSYSKTFHKPINRLVFYASFGNMLTNVGTLMARSFVGDSASPGCQFQAFIIQWFMPADTFWTLAMAVNVYLTFYYKFDAHKLRRMEIPYLIFCYGIPFIVALVYIFINTPERGRVYGDATLWCWISLKWDIWRIVTFYGPIWVVILITFFIYIRAGGEIYRKHRQLRNFSSQHQEPEPLPPMDDPLNASKTTEVMVTSEIAGNAATIDLAPLGGRRGSEAPQPVPPPPSAAYSVTISANKTNRQSYPEGDLSIEGSAPSSSASAQAVGQSPPKTANGNSNGNGAALGSAPGRRKTSHEANNAAWSYTKCALLFFTAMLVTWIPSSANRVYSVIHANQVNLTLEYMSAFVLPLQGFWNAIIYVVTSWRACKMLFHDIFLSRRPVTELVNFRPGAHHHHHHHHSGHHHHHHHQNSFRMVDSPGRSPRSDKNYESESMTELASRPVSHEHIEQLHGHHQERKLRMGI